MSDPLPVVYLARHGETAWTISHQPTGLTDLPLTAEGEAEAVRLGQRLVRRTSPALRTQSRRHVLKTPDPRCSPGLSSKGHIA